MVSDALPGGAPVEQPVIERVSASAPREGRRLWGQAGLLSLVLGLLIGGLAWRVNWPTASSATTASVRVDQASLATDSPGIDVHARLFSAHDVLADGWFFVAAIGEPEPWSHYLYRSTTVEHAVRANGLQEFHWAERLPVPKGVYQVTIWFHNVADGKSVHLIGGNFGLAPQLMGDDTPLHEFEGAAAIHLVAQSASYVDGRFSLPLQATAAASVTHATLTWSLRPADKDQAAPVYTGKPQLLRFDPAAGRGIALTLGDDLALPQGAYDLWLTVDDGDGHPQLGVYRRAVRQATASPFLRRLAPAGNYRIGLVAPPVLRSDWNNGLAITVARADNAPGDCALSWTLATDSGALVAHGDAGRCARPMVILPGNVDAGPYQLVLTAKSESGGASVDSDTITATAEVTP